ncbi:MAG: homoserine O-acetyltransferase [Acidimicrobiia bacterium]|nr:homoserine O-acetyltransferase [Acidimicrobiia bacterium]
MVGEHEETKTAFFDLPPEVIPFKLQSGEVLSQVRVAYETYGELSERADNAILVFHALTGSQHLSGWTEAVPGVQKWSDECQVGWWTAFVGPGKPIDTDRFFVIGANYLGGCYGSTGPSSIDPATGSPYGSAFPHLTVADIVDTQVALLDHLGIETLHAVIGGSVGGMMCLSLATRHPGRVRKVIPIAAGLRTTELQFIHNFEQTNAILGDPDFRGGDYYAGQHPDSGLALARMVGHKTFVSLTAMSERARSDVVAGSGPPGYVIRHPLESYMWYQGQKFLERFDANTYVRLMEVWQHFDLLAEAGETDLMSLLARCREQEFMIFSIDSDVCFYPDEQEEMAYTLRQAGVNKLRRVTVHSDKGHDAFLLEPSLFGPHLVATLEGEWDQYE